MSGLPSLSLCRKLVTYLCLFIYEKIFFFVGFDPTVFKWPFARIL
jgi:hypothetical protein